MSALPTGTVSFLFTDIEGSTRLLQSIGRDAFAPILERHNEILRELAGASVISTEGDSFFCAFDTASAAVSTAVEAQRLLTAETWEPDITLNVRMGIHSGEGVLGGDSYVGLDVHRAARIAGAAHGGQILISEATKSLVQQELPDEVALVDLGLHRLKDLSAPEHLYQLKIGGLRHEFPPPTGSDSAIHFPEFLTRFIGREEELRRLTETIRKERLVTLTGMGGSGKTRLAAEAGRALAGSHLNGASFIRLENAGGATGVAKLVAAEMSLSEQVGKPIEETLVDHLRDKTVLLILDDCEHVRAAVASLVEALLLACPGLRIVTTSREPLQLPGESIFRVGSMLYPTADTPVDEALSTDSVRLFVARAMVADPDFDAGRWATACTEISRKLEGLPLALELAAARVPVLTPEEILERLEDRFALLRRRSSSRDDRHMAMETAIDWSYQLLEPEARRLLRALSVFRGGFTTEAVARVCYPEPPSETTVFDDLTELSEKSFVSRQIEAPDTRFAQLETIREFAASRLDLEGERSQVIDRHRRHFTNVAEGQSRLLGGRDQLAALDRLEADHDNLRAAIERSVEEGDLDAAADVAGWLSWFWYLHAHFSIGEHWSSVLLDAMPSHPNRTWFRLLIGAGQYDFRIGAYDRAEQRLGRARDIAIDRQIPRMQMWAEAYLATNDLYRARAEAARAAADHAAELATDLGDMLGYGYATYVSLSARGAELFQASKLDAGTAAELVETLTPISEAVKATGERNMIGHVLQTEGILAAHAADTKRAAQAFDLAIESLSDLDQVGCSCHCLEAIASFLADRDDLGIAARLIGAADAMRAGIGIRLAPFEEIMRSGAIARLGGLESDDHAADIRAGAQMTLSEASQLARQTLARI